MIAETANKLMKWWHGNPLAEIARQYPIHLDQLPGEKIVVMATRAPKSPMSGGMAPAVKEACEGFGTKFWYAFGVPEKEDSVLGRVLKAAFNAYHKKTVPILADQVEGFRVRQIVASEEGFDAQYGRYSNRIVWPLAHNLPQFAKELEDDDVDGNSAANHDIAKRIMEDLNGDKKTPIWIHDYHHLPLATKLRQMGVENPIVYFHHIPMPTMETLNKRDERDRAHFKDMLNSLRACDAALFQTEETAKRFYAIVGIDAPDNIGAYEGHFIKSKQNPRGSVFIGHAPISNNTEQEMAVALTPELKTQRAKDLDAKLVAENIFINFERCDYSKGIAERVEAFEKMMKEHPELRGKAQLVLGAEPTRSDIPEYKEYAQKIDKIVKRLNADTDLWVDGHPPIIFNNQNIDHDDVVRLMRNRKDGQRRIGLVTPHEDGMNLTSKEFAAAQDLKNAGPLVLSSGAGSANELSADGKGAIIYKKINGGPVNELTGAMVQAIYMPQEEANERAAAMQYVLKEFSIQRWSGYHKTLFEKIANDDFHPPANAHDYDKSPKPGPALIAA